MRSSKPSKQRKAMYNAPGHVKRKKIRARLKLDKKDSRFNSIRSVTVRVGDEVEVVRGDHGQPSKGKRDGETRGRAGLRGLVVAIEPDTGKLEIADASVKKSDGKEEPFPIAASNVIVKRLDESDAKRLAKLQERAEGA